MNNNIEKRVIEVFVLIIIVLVLVTVAAVHNIRRSITTSDWVNHTHAVILEASGILSYLHAGDSALRSFLLTGDKRDQTAYRAAYVEMVQHVERAKALTRTEELQLQMFLQVEKLIRKRIDFTRSVVSAHEQEGIESARKILAINSNGDSLGEIQRVVQNLIQEENSLLQDRDRSSYLEARNTRRTIIAGITINFLLLVFAGLLIRDDIAARRRATAVLMEANERLEIKVKERTAELVKTNDTLESENLERRWSNEALSHQLRYNQLIINSISDLIFVITRALNISRINPAVTHHTRMELQDLVHRPLGNVLRVNMDAPASSAPTEDPIVLALKRGSEILECPGTLHCSGGHTVPVILTMVPVRDQDKVVGGVITARLCNV